MSLKPAVWCLGNLRQLTDPFQDTLFSIAQPFLLWLQLTFDSDLEVS